MEIICLTCDGKYCINIILPLIRGFIKKFEVYKTLSYNSFVIIVFINNYISHLKMLVYYSNFHLIK